MFGKTTSHLFIAPMGRDQEDSEVVTGDLPDGLKVIEDFVDELEEQLLLKCVDWTTIDKNITQGGKSNLKHRKVEHYGYEFLYGVSNVDINCPLEEGIPAECTNIVKRMLDQKVITEAPDQLTVNQYQPGQGIPLHVATHSAFTDGIVSLSLGSQVVMDFRHPDGRHVPVLLPRRSLAVMTGDSRYLWSHGIMQRKSDVLPVSKVSSKLPELGLSEEHAALRQASATKGCADKGQSSHTMVSRSLENVEHQVGEEFTQDFNAKVYVDHGRTKEHSCHSVTGDTHSNDNNASDEVRCIGGDTAVTDSQIQHVFTSGATDTNTRNSADLTLVYRGTRTSFTFRKVLGKPCTCKYLEQCDSQQSSQGASDKVVHKLEDKSAVCNDKPVIPESETEAQKLESKLVHQVYEEIAGHFSDTRHSPWPQVVDFLRSLPPGCVVLDVGCGNGKYLGASKENILVGCDRSENLCKISSSRGFPVFVCDCLALPVRSSSVDVAISIAVIHHLSTKERRQAAVEELVRVVHCGGQILIYVWALEQELNKKKSSYLKENTGKKTPKLEASSERNIASKEDPEGSCRAGCVERSQVPVDISKKTTERKSLSVHKNRTAFESQDLLVPWHLRDKGQKKGESGSEAGANGSGDAVDSDTKQPSVYHRYYHVFKKGELEELCTAVAGVEVARSYYDQGNWCVILRKVAV